MHQNKNVTFSMVLRETGNFVDANYIHKLLSLKKVKCS